MSTTTQNPKLPPGCETPISLEMKNAYKRLAETYAPVVNFHPAERFFPVDLPSFVERAALFQFPQGSQGVAANLIDDYGHIQDAHLTAADRSYFNTLVGWSVEKKQIEGVGSRDDPVPRIDQVYQRYASGDINARLTCYASICELQGVPNYHFVTAFQPKIGNVGEALILNYYFFFPAAETATSTYPILQQEGDWSAISLLFLQRPDLRYPERTGPTLAAYYVKMHRTIFSVGMSGLRAWNDVTRVMDTNVGVDTHPVVYISQGLHNCYYEPINTQVSSSLVTWDSALDRESVEAGTLQPSTDGTIQGKHPWQEIPHLPWWAYALEWTIIIFESCGWACGKEFDKSGLQELGPTVVDSAAEGGYQSFPAGRTGVPPVPDSDKYPTSKAPSSGSKPLTLNVEYVDLTQSSFRAIWGYNGYWGAASLEDYLVEYKETEELTRTRRWGIFGGCQRPSVGAWFLWNLYWDPIFGSDDGVFGYVKPTSPP
jgi:hypothetical protein